MSRERLINLQRLERQYLSKLSQNGLESPQVVQAAVDYANTLLREGRTHLKIQNITQAEGYFLRAKELTTPISINSMIFYATNFLMARGNSILHLCQLYEKQHAFMKAYMNLREVLPFMEKFAHNRRQNLSPDETNTQLIYSALLFHQIEVCRMLKRKDEMLDACTKIVEILTRLNVTYERLNKLTKDEFLKGYKKYYAMLSRALYHIGKSQYKVGFDKQSLKNLFRAQQISELIFGPDDPKTVKCQDKYVKLSQKMEFEMLREDEPIDFAKFKAEIHQTEVFESPELITLKKHKEFNHQILQQVKQYQQIVSQMNHQTSRFQMPEYIRKVRQEFEAKLVAQVPTESVPKFQQYKIKRKMTSQMQTRATSHYGQISTDKLFSPRLSLANNTQSQRSSQYQYISYTQKFKLEEEDVTVKPAVMELMIRRPQSSYIRPQKEVVIVENPVEEKKQNQSSAGLVRIIKNRQSTQRMTEQSDITKRQSIIPIPTPTHALLPSQPVPQQNIDEIESEPIQIPPIPPALFQTVKSQETDPSIPQQSMEEQQQEIDEVTKAVIIIQQHARLYIRRKKKRRLPTETYLKIPTGVSVDLVADRANSSTNKQKSVMKLSIKESIMKASARKGNNVSFNQILKEIKPNEIENTQSLQKQVIVSFKTAKLIQLMIRIYQMPKYEIQFLSKLLFDREYRLWTISDPVFRIYSQFQTKTATEFDEPDCPSDFRQQIQHIKNILSSQLPTKGLSIIVYITISNGIQKYVLNFHIMNFIKELDDLQKMPIEDQMQFLSSLMSLYCRQKNIIITEQVNPKLTISSTQNIQMSQKIISLFYSIITQYKIVKTDFGMKLKTVNYLSQQEVENPIPLDLYHQNMQNKTENLRSAIRIYLFQNILRPFWEQQQEMQCYIPQVLYQGDFQESNEDQEGSVQRSPSISVDIQPVNPLMIKTPSITEFQNSENQLEDMIKEDHTQRGKPILRKTTKQLTTVSQSPNILISPRFYKPHKSSTKLPDFSPLPVKVSQRLQKSQFASGPQISEEVITTVTPGEAPIFSNDDMLELAFLLPEFQIASNQKITSWQFGDVYEFFRPTEIIVDYYFQKQGKIIRPERLELVNELPERFIIITVPVKDDNGIFTLIRLIAENGVIMIEIQEETAVYSENKIQQLPSTVQRRQMAHGLQYHQIREEIVYEGVMKKIDFLLKHNDQRFYQLTLNRYLLIHEHYNQDIKDEQYQLLKTSNKQLTFNEFNERRVQIDLDSLQDFIDIKLKVSPDRFYLQRLQQTEFQSDFINYQSQFKLRQSKYYFRLDNTYIRVQFIYKIQIEFKTQLMFLANQQMKELQENLKKDLFKLLQSQQLDAKIKVYNPNLMKTKFLTLSTQHEIQRLTHILNHNDTLRNILLRKYLTRKKTVLMTVKQRNLEKYSELDTFLLMYIQNPHLFTLELSEKDKLLKQTILFYFFKQQLKLTLVTQNSSRFFMRTYFQTHKFYCQSEVTNIGKVYVETSVYKFNTLYSPANGDHIYYYFQISPCTSRTKTFKLVLDLSDVKNLLSNRVNPQNCSKSTTLFEIVRRLTGYLVCYRTNTYSGIKIPISYFRPDSKYDLLNTFQEVTFGSHLLVGQSPSSIQGTPKYKYLINDSLMRQRSQKKLSIQASSSFEIENMQMPSDAQILTNSSMLAPVYRSEKVIYKQLKKFNGQFCIITVKYRESFQICIYMPSSSRNFVVYIKQSDFAVMDANFLESIFPAQLANKQLIESFQQHRWKFGDVNKIYKKALSEPDAFEDNLDDARSYLKVIPQNELQKLQESKVSINEDQELYDEDNMLMIIPMDDSRHMHSNASEESSLSKRQGRSSTYQPIFKKQFTKQISNLSLGIPRKSVQVHRSDTKLDHRTEKQSHFQKFSPRPSVSQLPCGYQNDRNQFYEVLLDRKNNKDIISMFEIKIWEQLITRIQIKVNDHSKHILIMDNFKGVLREVLHSQIAYLGQDENAHVEVFINSKDVFGPMKPLRLSESSNFKMYMRITYSRIVNLKHMLRKALHSYYMDEKLNLQNSKLAIQTEDKYEFILADLKKCANYMLTKTKKLFIKDRNFNLELQPDEKCPQVVKVNIPFRLQILQRNYQYTQLLRTLLSTRHLIAIYYREHRNRFYLFIWNSQSQKDMMVKLSLQQVQVHIPNAIALLNLKLYQELGMRIFKSQKNYLLIQTFKRL